MGLSPGKGKKKVAEQEKRATAAIDNVGTADPLEARFRKRATDMLDWEDSRSANKNILDAPGMSDALDIYGTADSISQQELLGSGAGALANPANAAYQSQINEQGRNQRYNERAAGLSNALQGLKAQAYGTADSLMDRDFQRKSAQAGLEQNQLSQYYGRYKVQNPWYQKLFNATMRGAGAAGSVMSGYGAMK